MSSIDRDRQTYTQGHGCISVTVVLENTGIQERTRSTTNELEEHSQQRPIKDGALLGGSRGGSCWQTRMASECGPTCPVGCKMNQRQGQSHLC